MKKVFLITLLVCVLLTLSKCAPADQKDSPKEAQSAFVPAFDEIVVESSLTVRRKNDAGRQGRNKNNAPKAAITVKPSSDSGSTTARSKRQISGLSKLSDINRPRPFWGGLSGSSSSAHAQSTNVSQQNFGSSSTHVQNQAYQFDQNGLATSANIAATQHYYFPNGMKIDVNFAAGQHNRDASASSSSVIITHPSGQQTQL